MSVTAGKTDDALFSSSFEALMNKESDLGIGWRRPFLYMDIYHIPIDLEGRLYRQGQGTTNTRPFPKKCHVTQNSVFIKKHESLPDGRLMFELL
jgi:hypothetical protein